MISQHVGYSGVVAVLYRLKRKRNPFNISYTAERRLLQFNLTPITVFIVPSSQPHKFCVSNAFRRSSFSSWLLLLSLESPFSVLSRICASTVFSGTFGAIGLLPSLRRSGGMKTSKYRGKMSDDRTAMMTMCAKMKPNMYGGSLRKVWNSGYPKL